jgi:hypothetical protein
MLSVAPDEARTTDMLVMLRWTAVNSLSRWRSSPRVTRATQPPKPSAIGMWGHAGVSVLISTTVRIADESLTKIRKTMMYLAARAAPKIEKAQSLRMIVSMRSMRSNALKQHNIKRSRCLKSLTRHIHFSTQLNASSCMAGVNEWGTSWNVPRNRSGIPAFP